MPPRARQFHGDTLILLSPRCSRREESKIKARPRHREGAHARVFNQDGVLVAEFKRLVLVPRKNPGAGDEAEGNVD